MKNVVIYSTPSCVHCGHAKEFFRENGIQYTEYDVLSDLERRKELVEKSGQMGVPVILVDNEVVVGFDEERLRELLLGQKAG